MGARCSSCKGRGGWWQRWCYMGVLGRDFYLCQRCRGTGEAEEAGPGAL